MIMEVIAICITVLAIACILNTITMIIHMCNHSMIMNTMSRDHDNKQEKLS
jgi:hypothetical protein